MKLQKVKIPVFTQVNKCALNPQRTAGNSLGRVEPRTTPTHRKWLWEVFCLDGSLPTWIREGPRKGKANLQIKNHHSLLGGTKDSLCVESVVIQPLVLEQQLGNPLTTTTCSTNELVFFNNNSQQSKLILDQVENRELHLNENEVLRIEEKNNFDNSPAFEQKGKAVIILEDFNCVTEVSGERDDFDYLETADYCSDLVMECNQQEICSRKAVAAFIQQNRDLSLKIRNPSAIKDIRLQKPVYPEVTIMMGKMRNELPKVISLSTLFDEDYQLHDEFFSLWQVIVDLFRVVILYGYKIEVDTLRDRMVKVWFSWSYKLSFLPKEKIIYGMKFSPARWCKLVKYKLAAFAAFAKCDEGKTIYPKSPLTIEDNPKIILDKKFHRWFLALDESSVESRIGRMSLIDSICRGLKKGAPRAGVDDCVINQFETFTLFTEKRPLAFEVVTTSQGPEMLTPDIMENQIRRSVTEIFENCPDFEMIFHHMPSLSSSTVNSRGKGGQLKDVKSIPQFTKQGRTKLLFKKVEAQLSNPLPVKFGNETDEKDPLCREPIPVDDPDYHGAKQFGEYLNTPVLECSEPDCLGTDLDFNELCDLCLSEPSEIRLIALLEALKVRGISTPNGLETWLLKPLQLFISKQMSRHKVFTVTKTPLTQDIVNDVFHTMGEDEVIISGDYDNATNMIYSKYTKCCIEAICERLNLPPSYREIAVRSLIGNIVFFDYQRTTKDANGEITLEKLECRDDQKEAQPMGKVLSFVVLCILNFSVCRYSKELDTNQVIPIKKFLGLINGDDVFFSLRNPQLWVQCSGMIGLINSIGKTFFSSYGERTFIEMNSRSLIVDVSTGKIRTYLVPFVNFGLMKGLIRSENKSDSSVISKMAIAISKMSSCHRELTDDFDIIYEELDYLFKGYHKQYLQHELLSGVPYYIPKWLGGVGLNPGPNYTEKIPEIHRKAASVIFSNFEEQKSRPKAIVDEKTCFVDDIITKSVKDECKIHNVPLEVFHNTLEDVNGNRYDLEKENSLIYRKLVEQVWRTTWEEDFFVERKTTKEQKLFQKLAEKSLVKKLRHNSNLWVNAHAKASNCYVQPLPYYKLWHQKFTSYWPIFMKDGSQLNSERSLLYEDRGVESLSTKSLILRPLTLELPGDILNYISYLLREIRKRDYSYLKWSVLNKHLSTNTLNTYEYFPKQPMFSYTLNSLMSNRPGLIESLIHLVRVQTDSGMMLINSKNIFTHFCKSFQTEPLTIKAVDDDRILEQNPWMKWTDDTGKDYEITFTLILKREFKGPNDYGFTTTALTDVNDIMFRNPYLSGRINF